LRGSRHPRALRREPAHHLPPETPAT